MDTYQKGETVVCKATVTKAGAAYTPQTSNKIAIYLSGSSEAVIEDDMTEEEEGVLTYDFQTEEEEAGKYWWVYTGTDGTKISIDTGVFMVEDVVEPGEE